MQRWLKNNNTDSDRSRENECEIESDKGSDDERCELEHELRESPPAPQPSASNASTSIPCVPAVVKFAYRDFQLVGGNKWLACCKICGVSDETPHDEMLH